MSYYKINIFKFTELDNYKNGCDGKGQDHGVIDTKSFYKLEELQAFINDIDGAYIHEDQVEYQRRENEKGDVPTDDDIKNFKLDKLKLWLCNYTIFIQRVKTAEIENSDLKTMFNLFEE